MNTFVWNNNKPRENIPRVCSNAAIKRSVSTIYRRISIVFCFLSFVFGFGFLHRLESLKRISGIVRVYMRKSSVLDYCFRDVVVCVSVCCFSFFHRTFNGWYAFVNFCWHLTQNPLKSVVNYTHSRLPYTHSTLARGIRDEEAWNIPAKTRSLSHTAQLNVYKVAQLHSTFMSENDRERSTNREWR